MFKLTKCYLANGISLLSVHFLLLNMHYGVQCREYVFVRWLFWKKLTVYTDISGALLQLTNLQFALLS